MKTEYIIEAFKLCEDMNKLKYLINGFIEGKHYFKSFGLNYSDLYDMYYEDKEITKGNNTFYIYYKDDLNHEGPVNEIMSFDEFYSEVMDE